MCCDRIGRMFIARPSETRRAQGRRYARRTRAAAARRRDAAGVRAAPRGRSGSRDVLAARSGSGRTSTSRPITCGFTPTSSSIATRELGRRRSRDRSGDSGDQMRAFRFGRVVEPGTVTLAFEFTGTSSATIRRVCSASSADDRWYAVLAGRVGVRAPDRAVLRRAAVQDAVAGHARRAQGRRRAREHARRDETALDDGRQEVDVRRDAADAELPARGRGRTVRCRRRRHGRQGQGAGARRGRAGEGKHVGVVAAQAAGDRRRARGVHRRRAAVAEARPRRGAALLRRDGESRPDHVRRGDPRRRSEARRVRERLRADRRARGRTPVVRQPRHAGVVGRSVAVGGVRELARRQGRAAARRVRRSAAAHCADAGGRRLDADDDPARVPLQRDVDDQRGARRELRRDRVREGAGGALDDRSVRRRGRVSRRDARVPRCASRALRRCDRLVRRVSRPSIARMLEQYRRARACPSSISRCAARSGGKPVVTAHARAGRCRSASASRRAKRGATRTCALVARAHASLPVGDAARGCLGNARRRLLPRRVDRRRRSRRASLQLRPASRIIRGDDARGGAHARRARCRGRRCRSSIR